MSPKKLLAAALAVLVTGGFATTVNSGDATATFQVVMVIQKACSVTAGASSNINLGTVSSTAVNTTGSNTFTVNCSLTTPYYIGMAPSTANGGNTTGGGNMISTTNPVTNTSKVPYQLSSTAGPSGTPWGNTATSTSVGNGVAGIGTGLSQTLTVYATVASADFTPDSYADTVTINVNF
jgi:spore coat protein U-like protein